ncbi:GAF domain-containing sensor histidine kinase [Arcobacter sp. LA11]|uniref:sensor histidine kinase n=1 Tax=Arcobacter sp. LA11 TaxID=1898176 RepID=UPI000933796D|nr:GAF domain-containing sensor histidine kinase [Arcobacter sp. LA11]
MMKKDDELCHIYDMSLFNVNDLDVLLHEILKQSREILNSEAGSIYINEEDALSFNVFQNDAMSYENIYKQFYALKDLKLPLSEQEKYLAVQSFTTKKIIIIDDIYEAQEYDFLGVKEFDEKFCYRTRSIISAPLIHPISNKTLGVVQLLNKKENDEIVTYNTKDKQLLSMVSSFISLSIANAQDNIAKLKEINNELEIANEKLKVRVEEEINESERKSAVIFHQSKLASMGEMIGNIAHQWRQPLSAISTISSGLSFNIELGNYQEEETIRGLRQIVDTTKHLSQTIDDFREFYRLDKTEKNFDLTANVLSSISITEAALSENHIRLITNFKEDIIVYGYENELKQATLNIIQNAKDALLENLTLDDDKFIFIDTDIKDNIVTLKIRDNAFGIPEDIMDNIFIQNFTTKEENGGTGVGLYMTKEIIEKHMEGSLFVSNVNYTYENIKCNGAEFILKFQAKR